MKKIGVLTSGGDAPGMNAAVRAVVRAGMDKGAEVYAIYEGYQGMVDGGKQIRLMDWQSVGGILHLGGTVIGTARCKEFRERNGRLQAVYNLLMNGIDNLIIIGGDGSLTGAGILCSEWTSLVSELVESGRIAADHAAQHPHLTVMGLVGSIDNDMAGTDISIGADTALHRITDAVDALSSTAASHQRSFVVEVMGRNCGYLALMSAIATGADWVLIPESPPNVDDWETKMCEVLRNGRNIGRRDSIVIVCEGAQDRHGNHISSSYLQEVIEEKLKEETRVTILGHVQRGGAPSAFDRNLSTMLGYAAVDAIVSDEAPGQAFVVGIQGNKITKTSLEACLTKTHEIHEAIKNCDFDKAMELRGSGFRESFQTIRTLVRALPHDPEPDQRQLRIGVMNADACAPGMNTIVRAVVRLGLDRGHNMLGIYHGLHGLMDDEVKELNWMSVNGWAYIGGSELGTNRHIPATSELYMLARNLEEHKMDALLIIGGWSAYKAAIVLHEQRNNFPSLNIPIVCIPASIDNNLPGSELSVGADTALNAIADAVDRIKQSAVASRRVFVVEVMGGRCGYLGLMSAMATGAERVYLHEEGVTLKDLRDDVNELILGFQGGKRLGLVIRSEGANETYTNDFIGSLFAEEGGEYFSVRQASLGHLQQGGNPSPFDRILGTRMAARSILYVEEQCAQSEPESAAIGLLRGAFRFTDLRDLPRLMDEKNGRTKEQWWLNLRPMARTMARPAPLTTLHSHATD